MDQAGRWTLLKEQCAQLKALAGTLEESDPRRRALRSAALALLFASLLKPDEFAEFVRTNGSPLTPDQRQQLTELGLDPRP